jgi:type II secretory pathway pseudopilin PulG
LVELVVVIGIAAVVLGVILAGVVKAREAYLRTASANNLKQIMLALHHDGECTNGRLPTIGDVVPVSSNPYVSLPVVAHPSLFRRILPYLEQAKEGYPAKPLSVFISPADPSSGMASSGQLAICSYAANGQVFCRNPRLPGTFVDGTSNTISMAEHYGMCAKNLFLYDSHSFIGFHRPSFADYGDVAPADEFLWPPTVSVPQLTYQVAPSINECSPRLAQTPHASGMLVALGDGAVRQISPGISPTTYWAAVTPSGGEVLGNDW